MSIEDASLQLTFGSSTFYNEPEPRANRTARQYGGGGGGFGGGGGYGGGGPEQAGASVDEGQCPSK